MGKTSFVFIGVMSAIIGNAFATGETAVATKGYVDTKQDKIPGYDAQNEVQSVLTDTITDGVVGKKTLVTYEDLSVSGTILETEGVSDDEIPTALAVADNLSRKQNKIPKSGYYSWTDSYNNRPYNNYRANNDASWLNAGVKGTGLVTRTSQNGVVGERKIFESTDVSLYGALTGNDKLIADISIPTVGAMMTAITNNSSALIPAGTNGDLVTYSGTAGTVGSTTPASAPVYNATTGALENGTAIATIAAVNTMQKSKVCVGWPDNVEHTDANCWLWELPD